jgi:hypothetical protein
MPLCFSSQEALRRILDDPGQYNQYKMIGTIVIESNMSDWKDGACSFANPRCILPSHGILI